MAHIQPQQCPDHPGAKLRPLPGDGNLERCMSFGKHAPNGRPVTGNCKFTRPKPKKHKGGRR